MDKEGGLIDKFDEKWTNLAEANLYGLEDVITSQETIENVLDPQNIQDFATIILADLASFMTTMVTVAIFTGAERFSKQYNLSVVFADVSRTKRGFYSTKFTEIVNTKNSRKLGSTRQNPRQPAEGLIVRISPAIWGGFCLVKPRYLE